MLTNLNWLNKGEIFPPQSEIKRLETYKENEKLFLSEHKEAWEHSFRETAKKIRKKNCDVETIINYQQLLSKKTADFICGEPPKLECEQDTDKLNKLLEREKWGVKLYEAIIDISRYGNAVLKFVGNKITTVSPLCWFPIVAPTDLKTIDIHVLAYPITPDGKGVYTELYVEIHEIGSITTRMYAYDGARNEIGVLKSETKYNTGLDDFAVQILTNVTHSGSLFGIDDYCIVNSIVRKIMWRLHCADTVLDKHSEPSLSGPKSALTYDEHFKTYYLDLGNYFSRDSSSDVDVQYITWDGNLESSFKEIDELFKQLYIITEMGQAFMDGGGGSADSGTALKLRMVSPRIKASRIVAINQGTVKQIIVTLAALNGIQINYDSLTIHWQDGLPIDETEQITTLTTATGGQAIMSQYAAMKRLGLSDDEVEAELEQMSEERSAVSPVMLGVVKNGAVTA